MILFHSDSIAANNKNDGRENIIEEGDLVAVNYTAFLEDGRLVRTTLAQVAEDETRSKASGFSQPKVYQPEEFLAGSQPTLPGIGSEVIGMKVGEMKQVVIPPNAGFGLKDKEKIQQMPRIHRMPRLASLRPNEWMEKFERFPQVDEEVQVSPYFKSRVTRVAENMVEVEALVFGTKTASSPLGPVEIKPEGDHIIATLEPKIGAKYPKGEMIGRVVSADETTFSVDYNPPLTGETIIVDLEIVELVKASVFAEGIEWMDNHDKALRESSATGKPMVLVLYAGWCGWSKRLLNDSMTDPRVKMMKDRFVWVKIDSDKEKALKETYKQQGFPLVVFLESDGGIHKRIDGFVDAGALKQVLKSMI